MLFNTLTYLLFLPLVFLLYWAMPGRRAQNAVVVAASLVFYGWWDVRFLALMLITCLVNFGLLHLLANPAGGWTAHSNKGQIQRKTALVAALVINFGILGVFKYFNFFADNLVALLGAAGLHLEPLTLSLILPVGISFYTFQLSAYLIDCYRQRAEQVQLPSLMEFLSFICFFPQLVAGPIERGSALLGQFQQRRTFDFELARQGMRLILWGLIKKMLLADNCAPTANLVFEHYQTASLPDLWMGALAFTFQIYGDFSGYSDIAVGSARLLGIRLSQNFAKPYFATTIPQFWQRWHITLMSWFRDYVYIPLGGSHCSAWRHQFNVLVVFLLSGLWHGANWNFVLWGLYHALWFRIPHRFLAFPITVVGLVIFRTTDVKMAFQYIWGMFNPHNWGTLTQSRMCLVYIVLIVATEALTRHHEHPFCFAQRGIFSWQVVRMTIYLLCFIAVLLLGGQQVNFIYFQF